MLLTYTQIFHFVPVVSKLGDARGEVVVREGDEAMKVRTLSIPGNAY